MGCIEWPMRLRSTALVGSSHGPRATGIATLHKEEREVKRLVWLSSLERFLERQSDLVRDAYAG